MTMNLMAQLEQAEFYVLRFGLRLTEAVDVDLETVLRLRRNLRAAGQYALPGITAVVPGQMTRFGALFSPPLAADPVARRRFQRGGAAFVLQPGEDLFRSYAADEWLWLPLVLWGGRPQCLADLARVFQALGKSGLRYDAGKFELATIEAEDSSCHRVMVWQAGQSLEGVVAPLRDGNWWLNSRQPTLDQLQLRFVTPARLLNRQRPLFRADFYELFPFLLRRVSSMLYCHCHLEVVADPQQLLAAAAQVEVIGNQLQWQDWRRLGPDEHRQQPLGGLMGTLQLRGAALQDVLPYLALGQLMNVGKNAAYGAGHYVLENWESSVL